MVTDRTLAPAEETEVQASSTRAQLFTPSPSVEGMHSVWASPTPAMLTARESVEAIFATTFSIERSVGTGTGSEVVDVVRRGENAYHVATKDCCRQRLDEATLIQLPQGLARLATLQSR